MGHRALWTAAALLTIEVASVAWAWPRVERWVDEPSVRAWARIGERATDRAAGTLRSVTLRAVERTGIHVLNHTRAWWGWLGSDVASAADLPGSTCQPAAHRMVVIRRSEGPHPSIEVRTIERDLVLRRRVVSPEAIF